MTTIGVLTLVILQNFCIFAVRNHWSFALVWRCDIFARPRLDNKYKIGHSWHTACYRNNLRGCRRRQSKGCLLFCILLGREPWIRLAGSGSESLPPILLSVIIVHLVLFTLIVALIVHIDRAPIAILVASRWE